jgi:hypothetical protein
MIVLIGRLPNKHLKNLIAIPRGKTPESLKFIDLIEKSNETQYKAYKFLNDLIAKNDEKDRLKKDDLIARVIGLRRFP